jgi:glycosyltransferase 2 family protein
MIAGTLLALAALLSQIPSLSALWDTLRTADWWWIAAAMCCTVGNKVGYTLALMGSVRIRLPLLLSVEALFAAAFSNLAVPGVGSTAVQVRYLQLQGVDLASAVAACAVLANVANVVVQGALFLGALAFTKPTFDTSAIDLHDAASLVILVVFLAGVCVAVAFGVPRFRRHTLPPTRRGFETVRSALWSVRQITLLIVGNLSAALMSSMCLYASVRAFGGDVDFWSLLVANIVVGTVASLIPVPGGNTLVSAVGLSAALVMLGVPETVAVASVITQQLIAGYLPALPGWFATNDLLRKGML